MKMTEQEQQMQRESQRERLADLPCDVCAETNERLTDACLYTMIYADSLGVRLEAYPTFSAYAELHQVEKIYTRMKAINLTLTLAMADRFSDVFAFEPKDEAHPEKLRACKKWKTAVDETTKKLDEASGQIESFAYDGDIVRPAIPDGSSVVAMAGIFAFIAAVGGNMFGYEPLGSLYPSIGFVAGPMYAFGTYGHGLTYALVSMCGAHDRRKAGSALYSVAMNAYLDTFDQTDRLGPLLQPPSVSPEGLTSEGVLWQMDACARQERRLRMQKTHNGCKALNS